VLDIGAGVSLEEVGLLLLQKFIPETCFGSLLSLVSSWSEEEEGEGRAEGGTETILGVLELAGEGVLRADDGGEEIFLLPFGFFHDSLCGEVRETGEGRGGGTWARRKAERSVLLVEAFLATSACRLSSSLWNFSSSSLTYFLRSPWPP
jgi:hypothetical protein